MIPLAPYRLVSVGDSNTPGYHISIGRLLLAYVTATTDGKWLLSWARCGGDLVTDAEFDSPEEAAEWFYQVRIKE